MKRFLSAISRRILEAETPNERSAQYLTIGGAMMMPSAYASPSDDQLYFIILYPFSKMNHEQKPIPTIPKLCTMWWVNGQDAF